MVYRLVVHAMLLLDAVGRALQQGAGWEGPQGCSGCGGV